MRGNGLVVQRVPISDLRPMVPAIRTHPKKQLERLRRGLRHFGQVLPIPVSSTFVIIDLELVWVALKENGEQFVDIVIVESQSREDLLALRLSLNQMARDTVWQDANLRNAFQDLVAVDFDLDLTGFSPPEIDLRLDDELPSADVEDNGAKIPPLQDVAVTNLGVVWQLGRHRIGCGGATDAGFMRSVLDGRVASAAFTDLAWNIWADGFISGNGEHRHREFVQGAGGLREDAWFAFACDALKVLKSSCKSSALIYCCVDWRSITVLNVAARHCGMALYTIAVWTKSNGGMSGIYRNAHEMIPIYAAGNEPPLKNYALGRHGRNRTNVWSYQGASSFRRERNTLGSHPTAKPVALVSDALRDATRRGELVIDTFLGSGTTLFAAQETGRICYGTDLDPLHVDLVVRRWQTATGQKAVNAVTGETFGAVSQRLLPRHAEDAND